MDTILKQTKNLDNIIAEVTSAFYDIPFDNSAYQTEQFVIAASITPERAYRSIGLRMMNRINALNDAKYRKLNNEIDLDEINEKITLGELGKYEIRREQLKKQKAESEIGYSDKLINDAITELDLLYGHFKSMPRFTRAQFEAGEYRHFKERLLREITLKGAEVSLVNMHEDIESLRAYETAVKKLNGSTGTKELSDISDEMFNRESTAENNRALQKMLEEQHDG